MKHIFFLAATAICSLSVSQRALAQGMAVNNSGTAANASAMLDVSSTQQGVLVPRMTTAQRDLISSPATGLLIYQTDGTAGFYYYNGAAWTAVSGGGASSDHITSFTNISGATYTVLTSDQLIYSSNASTVFTLPTAATAGAGKTYHFIIGVASYSSDAIKVATSSGDLIYSSYYSGGVSNTLSGFLNSGFGGAIIVSDGVSKWYMISAF